jgi:DNA-binding response OmpR family regulator
MRRSRILVVDDDAVTRDLLRAVLVRAGHEVREAPDGRTGLRAMYATSPDLVILDVEMSKPEGWATLEHIRDLGDVPVLMLTAPGGDLERVRDVRHGPDDYLVKPVGHQELVARVEALLRRAGSAKSREIYADARLRIDFARREVHYDGHDVQLAPLELELLATFVRHPNQVLSRDDLLELVWGDALGVSPEQVTRYVGYLRHKLAPAAAQSMPIETVRGFGYRYRWPS